MLTYKILLNGFVVLKRLYKTNIKYNFAFTAVGKLQQ